MMIKYGLWAVGVLLAVLPAFGQEDTQGETEQTILLCDQIADGELKVTCEAFHQALLEKKLVLPEGQSAYDKYMELAAADPLPGLTLSLRIKLTGALQRELSDVLELATRLPINQTALTLIFDRDILEYRKMAESLAVLSRAAGAEAAVADWQSFYFTGLALREKALQRQSTDTALLMPAWQAQMEALQTGSDIPQVLYEAGSLALALGRYDQSKHLFLQANKLAPEWAAPLMGLSQYLAKFEEGESALKLADQAIGLQTDFAQSYLHAARLSARFNQPAKSVGYCEKAFDRIMQDIASGPAQYRLYNALNLADLLVQFELYEQAEFFLEKILAEREAPEAYVLLGRVYELTNQTLSADSLYRRCIAQFPDFVEAYQRGGGLYQGLGRYALAEPFLEKAYELNPENREVCFNLGAIRHLYDRPREAEELYRRALTYPKEMAGIAAYMDSTGRKIETGGQEGQLISRRITAAYIDPEAFLKSNFDFSGPSPRAYEDYIYANLGDLYYDQQKLREAVAMYEQALVLNPGQGEVYKSLIQACYDVGDWNRAMTYIQLYKLFIPYSSETREDWKTMNRLLRELARKNVNQRPSEALDVYTFFMDNLWNYLLTLKPAETVPGLNLDRALVLRQQRSILQAIRRYQLREIMK